MTNTIDTFIRRAVFSPFKKHLVLDDQHIEYHGEIISLNEITHIQYGILQLYVNAIKANRTYEIRLFTHGPRRKIAISFQGVGLFTRWYAKKEELYFQILSRLWPVTRRLANQALTELQETGRTELAGIELNREGIWLTKGLFTKTRELILWKDCAKSVGQGKLSLSSTARKRFNKTLHLMRKMDAVVLEILLGHLWGNGRVFALSRREKIDPIA